MDHMGSPPLHAVDYSASNKRKRSPSNDPSSQPAPFTKLPKTQSAHLQINYLVRQYSELLPLISADKDSLPSLLALISDYDGVCSRHESMACNLGARLLGPILIQRFERLFDGPPRVLKTHGKEGTTVGWLDVVDFAKNKSEQFNLEKMRDGIRVCQFYTKQCRVEISEEDFVLIKSGLPAKLIPPQPIGEDEEKELGTLEILEKSLGMVVQQADQVSARARQLNHRLKNRRNAIISRREAEAGSTVEDSVRGRIISAGDSGSLRHPVNGSGDSQGSGSPTSGFVAVNSSFSLVNGESSRNSLSAEQSRTSNTAATNGTSLHSASAATRAELLNKFRLSSELPAATSDSTQVRRHSSTSSRPSVPPRQSRPYTDSMEYAGVLLKTASPVPIPNTPSSLLPYVKASAADRFDDSGPYKADMMARMEQLNRGDRVQPPCDRCRRLHMDCLKNLTACMGCTKKHAKCSWKDVEAQELRDHPFVPRQKPAVDDVELGSSGSIGSEGEGSVRSKRPRKEINREMQGVRDEELLGEESEDGESEVRNGSQNKASSSSPPVITTPQEPDTEHTETVPLKESASSPNHTPSQIQEKPDEMPITSNSTSQPDANHLAHATTTTDTLMTDTSESLQTHYQAPQAQMQTSIAPDLNATDNNNNSHHEQTEYEKDIYAQLHDASREGASAEGNPTLEELVQDNIIGSEPLKASDLDTTWPHDGQAEERESGDPMPLPTTPMQPEKVASPVPESVGEAR